MRSIFVHCNIEWRLVPSIDRHFADAPKKVCHEYNARYSAPVRRFQDQ